LSIVIGDPARKVNAIGMGSGVFEKAIANDVAAITGLLAEGRRMS